MTITHYSEVTFAIDLIMDAYKLSEPLMICAKAREVLDIDITISQVKDYLDHTEDYEAISNSIAMKDLFDEKRV